MAAHPPRWSRPHTRAEWQARVDRASGGIALRPRDYVICLGLQALGTIGELYALFVQHEAVWGLAVWGSLCLLPGVALLWPWLRSLRLPRDEPTHLQVARASAPHQRRWHHTPGTMDILAAVRASEVPLLVGDVVELDDLVEADRASRQERMVRRAPARMTKPETAPAVFPDAPRAPGLDAPRPAAPASASQPMVRRTLSSSVSATA